MLVPKRDKAFKTEESKINTLHTNEDFLLFTTDVYFPYNFFGFFSACQSDLFLFHPADSIILSSSFGHLLKEDGDVFVYYCKRGTY